MEYSRRGFSYRTDKLPATSAIAEEYEKTGELGSYVAGLFTEAFCWDLLWSCQDTTSTRWTRDDTPRQPESIWVAPSWSWASRNHPVYFHTLSPNRNMFRSSDNIKDFHFDVETVSSLAPKGEIKSAVLTMRCHSWKVAWNESCGTASIYLDDKPCTLEAGDDLWFVHLAEEEPYNNPHSNGLILKEVQDSGVPNGNAMGVFKRVGIYLGGPQTYFTGHEEVVPGKYWGFPTHVKTVKLRTFKII